MSTSQYRPGKYVRTRETLAKMAAAKIGMDVDEYNLRISAGLKRCIDCREWKHRECYGVDNSRHDGLDPKCRKCRADRYARTYVPVLPDNRKPMGPLRAPRRDGDKVQARSRINHDVARGIRPDPNDLHCALCGHNGPDRRHEYHHHMGYAAEHHYDVLPVCTTCHAAEHGKS